MDGHTPPLGDTFGIHEAKTTLSKLVARAEAGEEIVLTRGGVPVARLAPLAKRPKRLGLLKGMSVPDSFFDPLPEEFLGEWPGA